MPARIGPDDLSLFRRYLESDVGLARSEIRATTLELELTELLEEFKCQDCGQLFDKSRVNPSILLDRVLDGFMPRDTTWFRDEAVWKDIQAEILPQSLNSGHKEGKPVKSLVLAAGFGQEAYSLALAFEEAISKLELKSDVPLYEIIATELSHSALFQAISGRYDTLNVVKGLPLEFRRQYFKQSGRIWEISPLIRKNIRFVRHNPLKVARVLGDFDIILARNFFNHLIPDKQAIILKNIIDILKPNGYLFLGLNQTISAPSAELRMEELKHMVVYRRL